MENYDFEAKKKAMDMDCEDEDINDENAEDIIKNIEQR